MPTQAEIGQFIATKRANQEMKNKWAREIITTALRIIDQCGHFVTVGNIETKPKEATFNSLSILLTTPFNRLEILPGQNCGYMLDIWQNGKVFSAQWEPLSIINLKRSDWLYNLFQDEN